MTSRRLIPRLTSEQKDDLLGDSHARETERKHASRTMERRTETAAFRWRTLQAYMGRASSVIREGRNIKVQFAAEIDAEQFQRFIVSADRGNP